MIEIHIDLLDLAHTCLDVEEEKDIMIHIFKILQKPR